jgi:hypothetical protein
MGSAAQRSAAQGNNAFLVSVQHGPFLWLGSVISKRAMKREKKKLQKESLQARAVPHSFAPDVAML